jgi:hypothetical protein
MPGRIRRGTSRTTHPVGLLRPRRERQRRRRAAEQRDEFAPSYFSNPVSRCFKFS